MAGCDSDDVAAVYCMCMPGVSITSLLRHHSNLFTARNCSYYPSKNGATLERSWCHTRATCCCVDVFVSARMSDSYPLPSTRSVQADVALNTSASTLHWNQVCISKLFFLLRNSCLSFSCFGLLLQLVVKEIKILSALHLPSTETYIKWLPRLNFASAGVLVSSQCRCLVADPVSSADSLITDAAVSALHVSCQ